MAQITEEQLKQLWDNCEIDESGKHIVRIAENSYLMVEEYVYKDGRIKFGVNWDFVASFSVEELQYWIEYNAVSHLDRIKAKKQYFFGPWRVHKSNWKQKHKEDKEKYDI